MKPTILRYVLTLAVALIAASAGTVYAQWISVAVPGTPRTPEGKADLKAPTPRTADGTPDLSGIWRADSPRYNDNLIADDSQVPMLPWAAEVYKHRVATLGYERPGSHCMPHGVSDAMTVVGLPFKIIQTPTVMVHLYEEFHKYRQIHTDGRRLPDDPDPAWYGYSVGRWEGDTFVVETSGFKEGSWLDNRGHPHTDALRTTERFRRIDSGRMEVVVTIDDPKAYSRSWTSQTMTFLLQPDTELLEHLCENNRDLERLQGAWGQRQEQAAPSTTGKPE
ncbi:MAG: hypothetical protein HY655_01940 [Acidobacteria bacterium]|nr:hypothetical protein [Acidobacteriota bacterium]